MFKIILKTLGFALLFSLIAMLPFIHDIIIDKQFVTKVWVPDLGIEKALTDPETGYVYGYSKYKVLIYFFLLHIFAAIGWIGWALDAKGKPYKFFLLIPSCMTFYTTLMILFDTRRSSFNEANTKIFLILVVNFLLMVFYFYRYYKKKHKSD